MNIITAYTPDQIEEARRLFREYEQFLAADLCFQNFEQELAELPGKYAAPQGALLIAIEGPRVAGCVALRSLKDGVCEMKRLFVRPDYRKQGLGRALCRRIIEEAGSLGYKWMRLDTLERLAEAMRLYEILGFRRVAPYYENPLSGVVYWELKLECGEI